MKHSINMRTMTDGMKILTMDILAVIVSISNFVYTFWQTNEKVESNVDKVLLIWVALPLIEARYVR